MEGNAMGDRSAEATFAALREAVVPLLGDLADDFTAGGLATLETGRECRTWIQVGLSLTEGRRAGVYAPLRQLAEAMCQDPAVRNFFFMHKPPGLRVRFEAAPGRLEYVRGELRARLETLRPAAAEIPQQCVGDRDDRSAASRPAVAEIPRQGVGDLGERSAVLRPAVAEIIAGVYEPERLLFGGPVSMPHVHCLFTVDARAWLAFHTLPTPAPAWAFSLALLRHLFDGLQVRGWEDLDVWDRIGRGLGRALPGGLNAAKTARAGAAIRQMWQRPELPGPAAGLAGQWGPLLGRAARDWHQGYFTGGDALIGPREGAALFTIFHWNRAALPAGTQSLLTSALADRTERP
jgi:hypothetical protein